MYYTRNSYTLTLNKNEYIAEVSLSETNKGESVQGSYKYEEEVEITAKVGSREGYTYGFTNFTSNNVTPVISEVTSTETVKKAKVTMPAENVTVTANGAREVNTYNIEYVLNGGANSAQNPNTYTVEDTINLQPATREGYTFNGWYEKEEGTTGETENLKETATTVISGRTGNITLYAKFTANGTNYIVEHYKEALNGTYVKDEGETEEIASTVDSSVTATAKTFTGFTYDENNINNVKTGTVPTTGTLTLKLYYKRDRSAVTVHYYDYETNEKIIEDEVLEGSFGENYVCTDMLNKTAEEVENIEELKAKYTLKEVIGNTQGTFTQGNIEVNYYYEFNKYTITGQAGTGGKIEGVNETVRYGENSLNDIVITTNKFYQIKKITINNVEIQNYEEKVVKKQVENSTKTIRVRETQLDKFENVKENKNIKVTFEKSKIVAKIIATPAEYEEELKGREFEFLADALDDIPEGAEGEFVIQIINDIEEEKNIIVNKNVKIDLNGHEVKAIAEQDAAILVQSGMLKVIDDTLQGTILNDDGIAIKVEEGGTLTLGADDENISQNPVIVGRTIGVLNYGTFNFYDGMIQGQTAISGTVEETPRLYNSSVTTDNNIQTAVLAKVTEVEALIGRTTYTSLEEAVAAANRIKIIDGDATKQVKIELLKDIYKENTVEISADKNILLDLGGYSINSSSNSTVINNSGKLEITDTGRKDEYGELIYENEQISKGAICSSIINNEEATLDIVDTEFQVNINTINYAIENSGSMSINNTTINSGKSSIRNTGKLEIENTKITAGTHGIVNEGNGELEIDKNNEEENSNKATNIVARNSSGYYSIKNGDNKSEINTSKVTIYNGTYNSGICNFSTESITIKKANGNDVFSLSNDNNGKIIIEGGNFNSLYNGRYLDKNYYNGRTTITGTSTIGTLYNQTGIIRNDKIKSEVVIEGGTINKIENSQNSTLELKNGLISEGIKNSTNAIINITGGTIYGNSTGYAIYNAGDGGVINIGNKDGQVDNSKITIENKAKVAVYNAGTGINYYEGTIIGNDRAIIGKINEVEDGKDIKIENYTENDNMNLEKTTIDSKQDVAQIGDVKYKSLTEAINKCNENINEQTEIKIIQNFSIVDNENNGIEERVINTGKNVVLNLNGYKITSYCESMIKNNGELTIKDEPENNAESQGKIVSMNKKIVENNGTLDIQSGIMEMKNEGTSSNIIGIINNTGVANLNGGKLTTQYSYIRLVENIENGKLYLNGMNIESESYLSTYGIYNQGNRNIAEDNEYAVTINSGEISVPIMNDAKGDIQITGGKITKGITNGGNGGNIKLTGGLVANIRTTTTIDERNKRKIEVISGNGYGIYNLSKNAKLEIEGINTTVIGLKGIYNAEESVTIDIKEATIQGVIVKTITTSLEDENDVHIDTKWNNNTTCYGILNGGKYTTINMYSGTIEGATGLYSNVESTISVIGGNIKGYNSSDSYSYSLYKTGYGIYNARGTITLGKKCTQEDTTVSVDNPYIYGGYNGVYNGSGALYFYDGVIKGKKDKTISNITEKENDYQIKTTIDEDDNSRETTILEKKYVVKVNSNQTSYSSIGEALENTQSVDNITILNDFSISEGDNTIKIDKNKNITLNLSGYSLTSYKDNLIEVEDGSTLTITDDTDNKDGKIDSHKNTIIKNNGTLNIEAGEISSRYSTSGGKMIDNNKNMNITGGKLIANGRLLTVISNNNYGVLEISGQDTKIQAQEDGITGIENIGTLRVNNGTITGYGINYGIGINNKATLIITKGTIEKNNIGILNIGNITIGEALNESSEIVIRVCKYGITNKEDGTITINNIDIGSQNEQNQTVIAGTVGEGIRNLGEENSKIEINNANIHASTTAVSQDLDATGGKIIINDIKINSNSKGISAGNCGQIVLKSGEINASSVGIDLQGQTEVTIGQESNTNTNLPEIIVANGNGISNAGDNNVCYKSGRIKVPNTAQIVFGDIIIPEGKDIEIVNETINNKNYKVATLSNLEDVVEINGGAKYSNINLAIQNVPANTQEPVQINILKDMYITREKEVGIPQNKKIILNLNGKNITSLSCNTLINNNGTLILKDLNDTKGNIISTSGTCIENNENAELEMNDINITTEVSGSNNIENYKKVICNYGTTVIKSGTIKVTKSYVNAIENVANLTMNGGTIESTLSYSNAIYNKDSGNANINGGSIKVSSVAVYNKDSGTLNISGGSIKSSSTNSNSISDESSGNVVISGGTIESAGGGLSSNNLYGKVTISGNANINRKINIVNKDIEILGGTIASISVQGSATDESGNPKTKLNVSGGTISDTMTCSKVHANITGGTIQNTVSLTKQSIADINSNGTISSASSNAFLCQENSKVIVQKGNLTSTTGNAIEIKSGEVIIQDEEQVQVTAGGVGIYISGRTGILTLGKTESQTEIPNKQNPLISGGTYGIQNLGGTFNYYDGRIHGDTEAINGNVTSVQTNFKVVNAPDEENTVILGIDAQTNNTILYNGTYYDSLQNAINTLATQGNGKIELNGDITLQESVQIPTGINVMLVMKGHSITYDDSGNAVIINEGTLKVINFEAGDENAGGSEDICKIINSLGTAIQNNGTLYLEGIDIPQITGNILGNTPIYTSN